MSTYLQQERVVIHRTQVVKKEEMDVASTYGSALRRAPRAPSEDFARTVQVKIRTKNSRH